MAISVHTYSTAIFVRVYINFVGIESHTDISTNTFALIYIKTDDYTHITVHSSVSASTSIQEDERPFHTFFWSPVATTTNKQLPQPRARRCFECAFGVLAASWKVLKTVIATGFETTENIILAAVVLHNEVLTLETDNASLKDIDMREDN
ncbi:hypothetical protein PoB_006930100 [Plakobranchus ocellatus]|uniref:DDE Tnp4 domain-containing protein n=1 Tax=Plakobranchus ocellatus TaxID=259542 RepID=A0AAV4DG35_9GAST|nr:hypothetical protein PoB_006930100 [Plakobranchus ocellatus]